MIHKFLKFYFKEEYLPKKLLLLKSHQVMPDCNFYLYKSAGDLFVLTEADYFDNMPWHAKEIEKVFNVKVEGWCVPLEYQSAIEGTLIPPDADDEGFINGEGPRRALTYDHGMYYGLLRVSR